MLGRQGFCFGCHFVISHVMMLRNAGTVRLGPKVPVFRSPLTAHRRILQQETTTFSAASFWAFIGAGLRDFQCTRGTAKWAQSPLDVHFIAETMNVGSRMEPRNDSVCVPGRKL